MGKKLLGTMINKNNKFKKKFKLTKKKLTINRKNLKSAINYFLKMKSKKDEIEDIPKKNEKLTLKINSPLYLYIVLKNKINDEEEIKKLKGKLFSIKHSLISEDSKLKIALVEDEIKPEEIVELNKEGVSKILNVFKKEEMKAELKKFIEKKIHIDTKYQMIITNSKYHLNYPKNTDIINYIQKDIPELREVITQIKEGKSLLNIDKTNTQIFSVKCAFSTMEKEEIFSNILHLIYNTVSYILANNKEYNEVESIILKSKDLIPLAIYGNIPVELIDYFKKE